MDEAEISYEVTKIPADINTRSLYMIYIYPHCSTHLEQVQKQGSTIPSYPIAIFGILMMISTISVIRIMKTKYLKQPELLDS